MNSKFQAVAVLAAVTTGAALAAPALASDFAAAPTAVPAAVTTATTLTATRLSPVQYADALVRAWGAGNRAETARLAAPFVMNTLFAYSTPGGAEWVRTSAQGAAGTTFVTYRDAARGGTVTVGIHNEAAYLRQLHAAYTVRFSRARPPDRAGGVCRPADPGVGER